MFRDVFHMSCPGRLHVTQPFERDLLEQRGSSKSPRRCSLKSDNRSRTHQSHSLVRRSCKAPCSDRVRIRQQLLEWRISVSILPQQEHRYLPDAS